jgi:hypothetical protein
MVVHMACQNACARLAKGEISKEHLAQIVEILMETQNQTQKMAIQHGMK